MALAESAVPEGTELIEADERFELEEAQRDRRILRRELEDLAYTTLDYFGGNEQDLRAIARRKLVQQARIAWQADPQIGAVVDLYNDFTLGRGVPKPKARDPKVQEALDEAWDDEDNKLVLTTYEAQLTLNTDITLQSNIFILAFFEGDDGKVKLSMLDHDSVESIISDKDNRRKHLWYLSRLRNNEWDYHTHTSKPSVPIREDQRLKYFQHWENEPASEQKPEANWIGKGRVYHVAINRTGEMKFGHPTLHRVLRWSSAFNSLMEARVDLAKAAAALVMKRKIKGTKSQVEKQATQALSRTSQLARSVDIDGEEILRGPRGSGGVLTENEGVEHETFSLDSQAQNANTDGQMIRSQISAGGRFPQHYLGDIGSANLATATSMELPVLKAIESRQEIVEGIFRWFCDLVIDRAIKKGKLDPMLSDKEYAEQKEDQEQEGTDKAPPIPSGVGGSGETSTGTETSTTDTQEAAIDLDTSATEPGEGNETTDPEEKNEDRKRDLSYDFSLPSPLRRMLTDLVSAASDIARTFDPNGTNLELSRTLLAVVLGEGLEMADPGEVVEKVFPPGYEDPALQALKGAQGSPGAPAGAPAAPANPYGPSGEGEGGSDSYGNGNLPNGAKSAATAPEDVREDREILARGGIPLEEAVLDRITHPAVRKAVEERMKRNGKTFDQAMGPVRDLAQDGEKT